MGPSSPNMHLGWVGVLCFFVPLDLSFIGVPFKVFIGLAKIDLLAFKLHLLLHKIEL